MPEEFDNDVKSVNETENQMVDDDNREEAFGVVGLGASAGGLEALQEFFANLQPTDRFAFIVVQHLSPDYKSLMPELLSRHTPLPVVHVEDGMEIEPGNVYILPPKRNLSVFKGKLFLTPQEPHLNLPIDIFFNSMAEEYGEQAVGIILSGTGSDGSRGVRALKEHGGMVIVQDEESAAFDGMPKSALSTGVADAVLSPTQMPAELLRLFSSHLSTGKTVPQLTSSSDMLSKILSLVKVKTGLDFSYYKENTIVRRIERRMTICQCESPNQYLEYLQENPNEILTLHREFLIGVTRFFRDPEAFDVIKEKVLPEILNNKGPGDSLRVWVTGCSTGEEAYSLAILLNEYCDSMGIRPDIKIFATDIDRDALDTAAQGIYPLSIAMDASMERLGRYFFKKGEGYQIQPHIRKQVIFAYHNLIKDPPFPKIDLITCRNLLIYLQPVLQRKVLSNFHFSLNNKGFLFLGSSETVGDFINTLTPFSTKWKIYRYSGGGGHVPQASFSHDIMAYGTRKTAVLGGQVSPQRDESDRVLTRLMEMCMPPTVLVDQEQHIQHIFGEVDRFFQLKAGKPQMDILKMARENISIPLGSALQKAIKSGKEVVFNGIVYEDGGTKKSTDIYVRVVTSAKNPPYYAVSFEPSGGDAVDFDQFDIEEGVRNRIHDLEQELQFTKENLQATIEELETSNEELQATNEELLAANEELQSTNEELQSVNEELITVNAEYQSKIHELTELNEDMDNLMSATEVGIIFLDKELHIRRYTEAATRTFNIIDSDLGRAIEDLSHSLEWDEFFDDLRHALVKGEKLHKEIRDKSGNWFAVSVLPHSSRNTNLKGVLLAMFDISRPKHAEEALLRKHELLMRVMESSPVATTIVDVDGSVSFANNEARQLLGISEDKVGNLTFDDPEFQITDMDGQPMDPKDLPFEVVKRERDCVTDLKHKVACKGKVKALKITGCPIFDAEDAVKGVVFKMTETDC